MPKDFGLPPGVTFGTPKCEYPGGGHIPLPAYIVQRESGGNYCAVNASSGAYGLYQILPSTWISAGCAGDPTNATPDEQDACAASLVWAQGLAPWGA